MSLQYILPELLIVLLAALIFALDLFAPEAWKRHLGEVGVAGLTLILVASLLIGWANTPLLGGMFLSDGLSWFFRLLFIVAAIVTLLLSMGYHLPHYRNEFYGLLLLATLGMCLMAAAGNLIALYVALETTSIALYVLAAYLRGDAKSNEAGIKYFLFGAFSSALLLYGMSLLFGLTGTTDISAIAETLATGQGLEPLLVVGIFFLMAGFGFKISAVPFHMWTPDVYEGAPTPLTAFVSVASKAAGFAALMRVFMGGLMGVRMGWAGVIAGLAVVTMTLGNTVAIPQTNIKRMLAYSSIAQAGYLLVGLAPLSARGASYVLFYLTLYLLTNLCAFGVVIGVSRAAGSDEITDFAGLSRRSPTLALVMMLALLSLGGIPPLPGFFGKLYIFIAAMDAGLIWLVVAAVINSTISLYYYLRVARWMYAEAPPSEEGVPVPRSLALALALTVIGMLGLVVYPSPVLSLAETAASVFF